MNSFPNLSKPVSSVLTVGISGVTCGGKSSLTSMLKTAFPLSEFICQDDFYWMDGNSMPRAETPEGTQFDNWDSVESLDWASMIAKVETLQRELEKRCCQSSNKKALLIVDGFLIFNFPPLADLCHLKYYITLPFDVCQKRRDTRCYDPPDPTGYFTGVAWPMHLAHLKEMHQTSNADQIQYLDGTSSLQDNFQLIMKDVQMCLDRM